MTSSYTEQKRPKTKADRMVNWKNQQQKNPNQTKQQQQEQQKDGKTTFLLP